MMKPENTHSKATIAHPDEGGSSPVLPEGAAIEAKEPVSPTFPPDAETIERHPALADYCRSCRQALTTAAHDLKTPIAILTGYIELMLSEKLGPLLPRQRAVLQEMYDNGLRLNRFVKNFLTLNQFNEAAVSLKIETADLNACLSEIIQVWAPSFQRKEVALFFSPSDKLQPFPFDYYKVQHVVSNLLDNALKFSPQGSTVWMTAELHLWERRVRQEPVKPEFERRNPLSAASNSVRVTVADSGPGIDPEFHQEIFQEFVRAETKRRTEGNGLGLAIARRLVNLFGGKIWVESEPGMGAKFAFLLPLKPQG